MQCNQNQCNEARNFLSIYVRNPIGKTNYGVGGQNDHDLIKYLSVHLESTFLVRPNIADQDRLNKHKQIHCIHLENYVIDVNYGVGNHQSPHKVINFQKKNLRSSA